MFDIVALHKALTAHGPLVRVVTADIKGSTPREVGAAMLVWPTGQSGTIGGGRLEYEACAAARTQLSAGKTTRLTRHPLGPELGQCCGGAVTLVSELITTELLAGLEGESHFARPVQSGADMPLAIHRQIAIKRAQGVAPTFQLHDGWLIEPLKPQQRPLWVWGAGHVGRALIATLAPLPDFDITWIDTAEDRFPADIPETVTALPAADPSQLVAHAPQDAEHLILTYSHALDLDLCHHLLQRGFGFAGLIGSKTKWARFQSRLQALGHTPAEISRITCPIGQTNLGKHPQAIAIGVASKLLTNKTEQSARKDRSA